MFAGNFAPAGWMPCEGQLLIGKEPTVTRRRFVQAGGAAAAGLYLSGLPAIASAASGPAHLRRSAYSGRVGTTFQAVSVTGATVALRLTGVADLARATQTRSLAGRDDAFALTFTGPPGSLRSGIANLRHPSLAWVALFITPVGRSVNQLYEVVVDRAAVR